jgi:hypothetical protein
MNREQLEENEAQRQGFRERIPAHRAIGEAYKAQ